MQKRKVQELPEDSEPKRLKREGEESTRERSPETQLVTEAEKGNQPPAEAVGEAPEPQGTTGEARRDPEPKVPTQAPKAFSSFFGESHLWSGEGQPLFHTRLGRCLKGKEPLPNDTFIPQRLESQLQQNKLQRRQGRRQRQGRQ